MYTLIKFFTGEYFRTEEIYFHKHIEGRTNMSSSASTSSSFSSSSQLPFKQRLAQGHISMIATESSYKAEDVHTCKWAIVKPTTEHFIILWIGALLRFSGHLIFNDCIQPEMKKGIEDSLFERKPWILDNTKLISPEKPVQFCLLKLDVSSHIELMLSKPPTSLSCADCRHSFEHIWCVDLWIAKNILPVNCFQDHDVGLLHQLSFKLGRLPIKDLDEFDDSNNKTKFVSKIKETTHTEYVSQSGGPKWKRTYTIRSVQDNVEDLSSKLYIDLSGYLKEEDVPISHRDMT